MLKDGTEKQVIKDVDGNMTRPRIRYASICDPFVVILREDDTLGLFIGEPSKSKLRRKDMSMLGDRVSPVMHSGVKNKFNLFGSLSDRATLRPHFIPISQGSSDQANRRISHPRRPSKGMEVPLLSVRLMNNRDRCSG